MADIIEIKQGLKVDLPTLGLAELGLTIDEERLYVGGLSGNIPIPNKADIDLINTQLAEILQRLIKIESSYSSPVLIHSLIGGILGDTNTGIVYNGGSFGDLPSGSIYNGGVF